MFLIKNEKKFKIQNIIIFCQMEMDKVEQYKVEQYKVEQQCRAQHDKKHCINCNSIFHVLKDCKEAITSFGIIIFKIVNSQEEEINDDPNKLNRYTPPNERIYPKIKFLMIQRKDTMSYIDFLRGKYSDVEPEKSKMIKIQFSEMTCKERDDIANKSFDYLWNKLWVNHNSRLYKNEMEISRMKFNNINKSYYLSETKTKWKMTEFGFPKGRKNTFKETNICCAEREFYEETGYEKCMYQFVEKYPIIEEEFTGTNNIVYNHKYYLVKLKEHYNNFIPKYFKSQDEVKNIGWYSIQSCLNLIRDYDDVKKKIITKVYNEIKNMNGIFYLNDYYYYSSKYYNSKSYDNSCALNDLYSLPILKKS